MSSWHTIAAFPGKSIACARLVLGLGCVDDVYSPNRFVGIGRNMHQVPWLGTLILARWDGDDPHAWYDVRDTDGVRVILGGWPPWSIADAEVDCFRRRVEELSGGFVDDRPPPCAVGDDVEFTYLSFYRLRSRCLWIGSGVVGVRIRMLGHDHILQVPWEYIERVVERIATRQHGRMRFTSAAV